MQGAALASGVIPAQTDDGTTAEVAYFGGDDIADAARLLDVKRARLQREGCRIITDEIRCVSATRTVGWIAYIRGDDRTCPIEYQTETIPTRSATR